MDPEYFKHVEYLVREAALVLRIFNEHFIHFGIKADNFCLKSVEADGGSLGRRVVLIDLAGMQPRNSELTLEKWSVLLFIITSQLH